MDYCIAIPDVASQRHLCSLSLPHCASTQSELVRASGICCWRPNCLELAEQWSAWSDT